MSDSGRHALGSAPVPGSRVGPYTIDASIGSGGVASVFLAHDPDGKVVAVKVLHPSRVVDEDVRRFTREYRALLRMDHPNIVRVFEAGVEGNYPWLAMEYVEGSDLDGLVHRWESEHPSDRWEQVERILRGLCHGLQYIHERGLVHRDLKPSNVLVHRDGEAKITDFGVVKEQNSATTTLTIAGRLVGTVAFMAPEQITGDIVDARADLYALGAALYMMLTYRRPIEATSVAGYLARHLTEVPRAPREIDPGVPRRFERICQRLLLKDPAQRFPSANAVLEALDRPEEDEARPLRGREFELQEWGRCLATLGKGGGGCVVVSGSPGSGRSHLLREMVAMAESAGIAAVSGRGDVRGILGVAAQAADDATDSGNRVSQLARLANALHGQPTVWALDDLDRAAPEDIEDIARLVRQLVANEGEALLLVFTTTDEGERGPVSKLIDGGITQIPSERIALGPLERRAIQTVLRDIGLPSALSTILSRRLESELDGNLGRILEQIGALREAGWIAPSDEGLRPTRPMDEFRKEPLPAPPAVRRAFNERVARLSSGERRIVEILAVIDHPAPPEVIVAAANAPDAAATLDDLVEKGLLRRTVEDSETPTEVESLWFVHPSLTGVVRERLSSVELAQRHAAVAKALLGRRRRDGALEVAKHLLASGELHQAYPLLVQAARAASRSGRYTEVFDIATRAAEIRSACEVRLDAREAARHRRWLCLLEGEARLARGEWEEAIAPLELAVSAARVEEDRAALSRTLGSLGRAHYRLGRFDRARPLLEEALIGIDPGAPERAAATRALADILMRSGDLDGAEQHWEQALAVAKTIASRDGEARACRGLAHVRVLQGQLDAARKLLDVAEDLLNPDGDERVRAAVLARSIELDTIAGRYGAASRRCEVLLDLVRDREMPERVSEAWALSAEVRLALGDVPGALEDVRHAMTYARASHDLDARIRVARILCACGHPRSAAEGLPQPEEVQPDPVDDVAAQIAAVRARTLSTDDPELARDLATWVIVRPAPLLAIRAVRIAIDAAATLAAVGDPERARTSVKRGLKLLPSPGSDGLGLELLLALYRISPDERVLEAAGRLAERIAHALPNTLASPFRARSDVAMALATTRRS